MPEPSVGQIIWQQITVPTKMACGAKNAVASDKDLWFSVTIKRGVSHKIGVIYNKGADDYTVKLVRIRGAKVTEEQVKPGVGVENLNDTIYRLCNN